MTTNAKPKNPTCSFKVRYVTETGGIGEYRIETLNISEFGKGKK